MLISFYDRIYIGDSMDFFRKIFKKNENIVDIPTPIVEKIERKVIPEFESDEIVDLYVDNFVNTEDPLTIAKFISNLKIIENRVLQSNNIGNLVLIRNDTFLPPDWVWRVNSKDTLIEKESLKISSRLREELATENVYKKKNIINKNINGLRIPVSRSDLDKELQNMDNTLGNVYMPVRFRSTKHFTINTALGYTGSYNFVESERDYTIIDSIDNFINSGYVYSLAGRDAYLDITHKGLDISKNAIVLIEKSKYEEIKNNEVLFSQLQERRVVTYSGNINIAINMLLAENGILPFKVGNVGYSYSDKTLDIIEDNLSTLATNINAYYDQGHGNINGKGGHFSDIYDGKNMEFFQYKDKFVNFLNSKFKLDEPFNNITIDRDYLLIELCDKYGVEAILAAIEEYNELVKKELPILYKEYVDDRNTMTESDNKLFQDTLLLIKNYHENQSLYIRSMDDKKYIEDLIAAFFHSNKVFNQKEAAIRLTELLTLEKNNEYNK